MQEKSELNNQVMTTIDYNKEYKEHLRCPNCNRKTAGIDDYKNIRSGKITKTCAKCRASVYKSYRKIPRIKKKKITMKEKVELFNILIKDLDKLEVEKFIENNPTYENILKTLITEIQE